jgi:hypothetical protein
VASRERYLGHFLTEDPLDLPWSAVEYVASQLDIADPSVIKRYTERQPTAYEHSWEIRAAYGYRDFADPGVHEPLVGFMAARAWIHAEGAVALFEQAEAWLRRERVLLPGVSVLARLVATIWEDTDQRMYRTLAEAAAGADVSNIQACSRSTGPSPNGFSAVRKRSGDRVTRNKYRHMPGTNVRPAPGSIPATRSVAPLRGYILHSLV